MVTTSTVNQSAVWEDVLEALKTKISINTFNVWFADVAPLRVEGEGKVLVLSVPNELTRTRIQKVYRTDILSELRKLNSPIREIKLTISRSTNKKKSPRKKVDLTNTHNSILDLSPVDKGTNLNTDMTFDDFVVVGYNQLAFAAAEAIIAKPGYMYNPFYLYGPTGVGKTHLLQAIGNKMRSFNPSLNIRYTTTETFLESFINAVKCQTVENFRKEYASYHLLLLDDIHFLEKSEAAVVELFHMFNTMVNNNSQIIFSSDRRPQELDRIEERIKTRLSSGAVIDIESPSVEDMLVICKEKAKRLGIELSPEALDYILENISPNIREINGALKSVHLHTAALQKKVVGFPEIKSYIRNHVRKGINISHKDVIKTVCEFYNIQPGIVTTKVRRKEVVHVRQVIMFILREYLNCSYAFIGREFGNRDHTTVMHSCAKISEVLQTEGSTQREMGSLKKKLGL